MARLDLLEPRRDEDALPGVLPSADFRARQREAAAIERAAVLAQLQRDMPSLQEDE